MAIIKPTTNREGLVDPGHFNGYNPFLNTSESEQNMIWAKKFVEYFNKTYNGFTWDLGRDNETVYRDMPMKAQASKGYFIVLSNHSDAGGGSGCTIYGDVDPRYSDPNLMKVIGEAQSKALGIKNNGNRFVADVNGQWTPVQPDSMYSNYYYEIANSRADMGTIIFERYFHDKYSEASMAIKPENVTKSAVAVADAIAKYWGLERKDGKGLESTTPVVKEELPKESTSNTFVNNMKKDLGKDGSSFRIKQYGQDLSLDWCSTWVTQKALESNLEVLNSDDVNEVVEWASKNGIWYSDDNRQFTSKPKSELKDFTNTLIVLDWNDNGWGDHIGGVNYVKSPTVFTVEGNVNSGDNDYSEVAEKSYSLNSDYILGFIKLKDKNKITPTPTKEIPKEPVEKMIDVSEPIKGYISVDALKEDKNGIDLPAGKYYIYKEYEQYKNISNKPDVAGAWVLIEPKIYRVYQQVGAYAVEVNAQSALDELKKQGKIGIVK